MNEKLIKLYADMAELTAPECASSCRVPYSCCDAFYCGMSNEYQRELKLEPIPLTDNQRVPYLGPTGCVVPPHLRPSCTLHTCDINNLGFKRVDPEWTKNYFDLRGQIEAEHAE